MTLTLRLTRDGWVGRNVEDDIEDKGMNVPESFNVRPARLDDVDDIVGLLNAAALVDTGGQGATRHDILMELQTPQFNIETDSLMVLAASGELAAYAILWDQKPHVRHYVFGRVHPGYRGLGLGRCLLQWAEEQACARLDQAPEGARVSLHTSAERENGAAQELFGLQGLTLARHFFHLCLEMSADAPPPAPALPPGVTLQPLVLGQNDRAAHQTLQVAFRDHWGSVEDESFEEWIHWVENDPTFDAELCVLATTEAQEVVGVAMCRPEYEQDPSLAWIDELGVLREWRRQGIAQALLHQAFGNFHRRGRYKVGLGVDADSLTGALRLYEKVGMRVFRQRDAFEKILRPGQDLSTQSLE